MRLGKKPVFLPKNRLFAFLKKALRRFQTESFWKTWIFPVKNTAKNIRKQAFLCSGRVLFLILLPAAQFRLIFCLNNAFFDEDECFIWNIHQLLQGAKQNSALNIGNFAYNNSVCAYAGFCVQQKFVCERAQIYDKASNKPAFGRRRWCNFLCWKAYFFDWSCIAYASCMKFLICAYYLCCFE